MLSAGPAATGSLLWRRGVRRRWREVAFGCGDELTQAVARIASITAMILFAGGMTVLSAGTDHTRMEAAMLVLQGGSLAAWGLMFDLLWRGKPCRVRRICGVAADTLCVTLLLCVGGPSTQVWIAPVSRSRQRFPGGCHFRFPYRRCRVDRCDVQGAERGRRA
jgi:hypothetical protein